MFEQWEISQIERWGNDILYFTYSPNLLQLIRVIAWMFAMSSKLSTGRSLICQQNARVCSVYMFSRGSKMTRKHCPFEISLYDMTAIYKTFLQIIFPCFVELLLSYPIIPVCIIPEETSISNCFYIRMTWKSYVAKEVQLWSNAWWENFDRFCLV